MLSCFQEGRIPRDVTSQKAESFLEKISDFKFIVCLVITMRIMLVTFEVTNLLQEKELDIIKGIHLISTLHEDVKARRSEVDEYHNQYYNEALQLAKDVMEVPRIVSTQYRANTPGSTAEEYYKNNITIAMLDHFSSRFNEKTELVYKAFAILPNYIIDSVYDGKGMHWRKNVMEFAIFYRDDLSNYHLLDTELSTYHTYWVTFRETYPKEKIPSTLSETLKHLSFQAFTNINFFLRILGTIPVTTCTCERCISKLRLLKD